jgi:hypothetical protein
MKTLFFLIVITLVQISLLDKASAEECFNFTGSYKFENTMAVDFKQTGCSKIDVAWGSDRVDNRISHTFSLVTSSFKKDPFEGFGARILSYRYNIIGHSLVMSYKTDGSQQVGGYAFTINKNGTLKARQL